MSTGRKRRIVLTGASRGLGRAMVEGFVARGHAVAGCATSGDKIEDLSRRYGPPHRFDVVDVSRDDRVRDWAAQVLTEGPVDILINAAAVINGNAPLWRVGAEEFSRVIDVNVKGVVNVIRHFGPAMVERRRGLIVNFSSYWGRSGAADVAPYCASKFAIEGLTQSLAKDLPPGTAAVSLNPGIIDTEMLESCFGEAAHQYMGPAQWAETAVPYILSLDADDNGRALTVPGQ